TALTEIDARDTFHYQMSQVEETQSRSLTVDADLPSVFLDMNNDPVHYMDGAARRLVAQAQDATTVIARVVMTTTQGGLQQTATAPRCSDDQSGRLFCPLFDPEFAPGAQEGVFHLAVQSMDGVGQLSTQQVYTISVDSSGPRIAGSATDLVGSAQRHPTLRNTWFLPLSFTVQDPGLDDGSDPSGLDPNSVRVTIYSPSGQPAGQGTQIPTYDAAGGRWTLDYLFPEKEPSGRLVVVIEATDRVSNHTIHRYNVLLDASPGRGQLNQQGVPQPSLKALLAPSSPQEVILNGRVLSGTVSDTPPQDLPYYTAEGAGATVGIQRVEVALTQQANAPYLYEQPYPSGLLAWLPLDKDTLPVDSSGEPISGTLKRLFLDISPNLVDGECDGTDCPWSGLPGHFMGSTYFDGRLRRISLGQQIDLANRSFSLSIWARRGQAGHNDPFLWQGPVSAPERRILLGVNAEDRFVCGFGGADLVSPLAYSDTAWHFWACTYDAASGLRTIYRDGEALASDTSRPLPRQFESLYIGLAPVGAYLGYLDDLRLYDRPLDAAEVRQVYTGDHTVFQMDVKQEFYAGGDLLEDSSGFYHQAQLDSGPDDLANKVINGRVGMFGLALDGNDRLVVPPSYSLDLDRGALTLAAWVFPSGSAGGDIISQRDVNPEFRYPSLALTAGNQVEFGFGDGYDWHSATGPALSAGSWHFIAVAYADGEARFYLDGAPSGSAALPGARSPFPSRTFSVGQGLTGSLDDVRVYPRALDNDELTLLMNTAWQTAHLTGEKMEAVGPERPAAELAWNAGVPDGLEGAFQIDVRGCDNDGRCDTNPGMENQWGGTVDTLAPRIAITAGLPVSGSLYISYTFSVEDQLLDLSSLLTNLCSGPALIEQHAYNNAWYLAEDVLPDNTLYRITGACSGLKMLPLGGTLYACDLAGNCARQTLPPVNPHSLFMPLIARLTGADRADPPPQKPLDGRPLQAAARFSGLDRQAPQVQIGLTRLGLDAFRNPLFAVLQGQVSDAYGVRQVEIQLFKDGAPVYHGPAALSGRVWNALWIFRDGLRPAPGVYLLQVTAVDWAGNRSTIQQEITVP
ncbi:MAG: LamG domain-containing protein, partial [Chloroflexota bacterium]